MMSNLKYLKKSALALNLNRTLDGESEWNESRIKARSRELFKTARRAWPHPKT